MQEFVNIALSFPTIVWSGLLGVIGAYWLFVILGALDLEFLDTHLDLDLELDFDIDLDVDADLDVDVDGADIDGGGASVFAKAAAALGIGKVPLTILASFFAVAGWAVSYFGMLYLPSVTQFAGFRGFVFGLAVMIAIPVMGALAHPLKGVFTLKTRRGGYGLIGKTCEISTGSVSGKFGQARLEDEGAGLLLSVRSEEPNELGRKSVALIVGYDEENDTYSVEPYSQFLPSGDDDRENEAAASEVVAEQSFIHEKQEA